MIPKVKLIFDRRNKADQKNEGEVEVYIYHNGKKRYLSTGIAVRQREYSNGTISMRADAVELNKRLQRQLRDVQEQINDMIDDDCLNISNLTLRDKEQCNFIEWGFEAAGKMQRRQATINSYVYSLKTLNKCPNIKSWTNISAMDIESFESWLISLKIKASSRNTIHTRIATLFSTAVRQGVVKNNPYADFAKPRGQSQSIKYLTEEQVSAIEQLKLAKKSVKKVRDMFLLSCYTGLRWSDICAITKKNAYKKDGNIWIKGITIKTSSEYNLLLLPQAVEILDRYNWNMSETYMVMVYHLKSIAKKIGIPKLTFHMARHTFATWALSNGVRIEVVSKILTHTDIKTTQIYAKVLQKDVEAGFNLLAKTCANV